MNLDQQIAQAQHAVTTANTRGDTRALHVAIERLKELRHRRMRRDRRRGLFKSAAEAAAGVFIAVASVVLPGMIGLVDEAAYAATEASAAAPSFRVIAGIIMFLIVLLLGAFALANMADRKIRRHDDEMFPDPDKRRMRDHRHWGL